MPTGDDLRPAPRSRRCLTRLAGLALVCVLPPRAGTGAQAPVPRAFLEVTPRNLFGAPAGVISPDGHTVAFAEWEGEAVRRLHVQRRGARAPRLLTPDHGDHRAPAWSPDGRQLAFVRADAPHAGVWTVDVASGARRRVYAPPTGAARFVDWMPAGDAWLVIVAVGESTHVARVAPDGARVVARGVGFAWPAVSPDGSRLALVAPHEGRATLAVVDLAGGAPRPLAVDLRPGLLGGPAWSPDGRTIHLAAARGADPRTRAWAVDAATGDARRIDALDDEVARVSVTRDGRWVAAVDAPRLHVAVLPVAGGTPTLLDARPGVPGILPAWSPDGRHVAYTAGSWDRLDFPRRLDIARVAAEPPAVGRAGRPRVMLAEDHEDFGAVWSPDGRWVLFHSHRHGTDDVYVAAAADSVGAPIVALSSGGRETGSPSWSPDGRRVAFTTHVPDGSGPPRGRLLTVGFDPETGRATGTATPLSVGGFEGSLLGARYSPDGATLAASGRTDDGRGATLLVPAGGGAARVLATYATDHGYSTPEWTPDGRAVIVAHNDGARGPFRLWRIDVATGRRTPIPSGGESVLHPRLSPDGRRLAVTVRRSRLAYYELAPVGR